MMRIERINHLAQVGLRQVRLPQLPNRSCIRCLICAYIQRPNGRFCHPANRAYDIVEEICSPTAPSTGAAATAATSSELHADLHALLPPRFGSRLLFGRSSSASWRPRSHLRGLNVRRLRAGGATSRSGAPNCMRPAFWGWQTYSPFSPISKYARTSLPHPSVGRR